MGRITIRLFSMKNVLITGVNGFLGRNIAECLLAKGYNVCGISRHNDNITNLMDKIAFFPCDLHELEQVKHAVYCSKPDIVVHCAWNGGNSYELTNSPIQFQNVKDSVDLLDVLKSAEIPYFMGLGSFDEYGDSLCLCQITEDKYEIPINLYGACKKMVKEYSRAFCRNQGTKWAWVRPSYVYGYGDVPTRLLPKVIRACLKKESLKLNSCKSQTDYIYIDDFVEGVYRIIETQSKGIYNVCSGNLYLVRNLVEVICKETGHFGITFDRALDRPGVPIRRYGSNERLKELGWSPEVDIIEGLLITIRKYKENAEHNILH